MMSTIRHESLAALRARLGTARAYALESFSRPTGMQRFVILTSGRAGSELLVSLLQSHPQISCDTELFGTPRLWPDRLLAGRVAHAARQGSLAYGVKVQPQHILDVQRLPDPNAWVRSLSQSGWRVIRLGRANRLHQAISVTRAALTQWHYRHGEFEPPGPIALDPNAVIGTMYLIQHKENQIVEMLKGVDHLDLCYEDHLQLPQQQAETLENVCRFLNIELQPMSTNLARVTPAEVRDTVTNYDEIADVIRRNAFVDYLTR